MGEVGECLPSGLDSDGGFIIGISLVGMKSSG